MSSSVTQQQYQRTVENRLKAEEKLRKLRAAAAAPAAPVRSYSLQAVIKGSCVLLTRERFCVEMGYHDESVKIFKSIPNSRYEPLTKKWTFPLSEHNTLIEAMESLKPNVTIGCLPAFVRRIFKDASPTFSIDVDSEVLSRIDEALFVTLFQFQKEGISLGVKRHGRILIADDMGLGKTIQALGIAHYYYNEWPLLIVSPASMRYGWREAIWQWLPSIPGGAVCVIDSNKDWDLVQSMKPKVVIVSYDFIHKHKGIKPQVVIFDESHHLKNFKTARTKASIPIIQSAKRAILLSGTPALSRPIELFTQVSALRRDLFQYDEFGIRYCAGKKNTWGWDFQGASHMQELQLLLEETIMVRRMKSEVLTQLPAKQRQMLILDPTLVKCTKSNKALQFTASEFNKAKGLSSGERHGKLLQYYSDTAEAKVDAVLSYITDLVEDGKKFLCFAHHFVILDAISEKLESLRCKYIRIDGRTGAEERKKVCDEFQMRDDIKVAVLSILAANSGITLTAANLIVFAELYYNPGILTQAEDRAHRIGQKDSVLVQYLVAQNTADDHMWGLVVKKLDVLNKVGLSKDNFMDADAEALVQYYNSNEGEENKPPSQQPRIDSFFPSISSTKSASQPVSSTITNDISSKTTNSTATWSKPTNSTATSSKPTNSTATSSKPTNSTVPSSSSKPNGSTVISSKSISTTFTSSKRNVSPAGASPKRRSTSPVTADDPINSCNAISIGGFTTEELELLLQDDFDD